VARPARLPPEALRPYLLDVPNPALMPPAAVAALSKDVAPLDWSALFGNDHPVEIEVGFGKGLFLQNAGRTRPDTNFLGIEIERKYVLLTAARLARQAARNVKLAATDARWLLRERVRAGSVAAVHVYFPDPWWKTRHKKRKLFTAEFAEQCARVLRPGGRLHFVSDVREYFDETLRMLAEQGRLAPVPVAAERPATDETDYLTNFERKYRKEGRPIYRAVFQNPA
jgi:tRNA (guanine-N7-)-methyltransferase